MKEAMATDIPVSFIDWRPVIAGAVVASALSFVLFTAGAAIGLSLVSPYPSQSYGRWAASIAAFWAIFVPLLSLLIGGYIAGRMRVAWSANPDEVQFRDGVHGLMVWSTAVLIGVGLAFFAASSAVQSVGQVGAQIGQFAASDQALASSIDLLVRPAPARDETPPAGQASQTSAQQTSAQMTTEERERLSRVFMRALASGKLAGSDKNYVAEVIARFTGLSPEAAEKRVDETYATALKGIDDARKASIAAGLSAATALLLGLAAAWYAAQRGGYHRDQNIPARFTGLGTSWSS